jgi:Icc-related predicted phosphoesterase
MKRALRFASENLKEVVYVTGNHEHYKSTFLDVFFKAKAYCSELGNIHFLENSLLEIQGTRFLGATLWFRYHMGSDTSSEWAMNDFDQIHRFRQDVGPQNLSNTYFLENEVREGDVVITHHLPSTKSIHPMYSHDPLNKFFFCDMEHVIQRQKPKLWVHGHTHNSFDYPLGDTRVVCNPFGYVGHELNQSYQDPLIIEV